VKYYTHIFNQNAFDSTRMNMSHIQPRCYNAGSVTF